MPVFVNPFVPILIVMPDETVSVSPLLTVGITNMLPIVHVETPSQEAPIAVHDGPSETVPPNAKAL